MIIQETLFVDGKPVGQLLTEANTQTISFHPANGESRLSEHNWESVEELREAAIAAYKRRPNLLIPRPTNPQEPPR